ncbi:MAG: hypothetical protein ACI9K1_001889 [Arcticibacterium sp.]|jgi:hypothetical protein
MQKKRASFLNDASNSNIFDSNFGLYLATEYSKANGVRTNAFIEDSKFVIELYFKTKQVVSVTE